MQKTRVRFSSAGVNVTPCSFVWVFSLNKNTTHQNYSNLHKPVSPEHDPGQCGGEAFKSVNAVGVCEWAVEFRPS